MKLNYKILWFEDETGSYNAKKEIVRAFVEDELGFAFPEPTRRINSHNLNDIDYSEIDLILVDLNLADKDKGPVIVDFIRNAKHVFTDVIFYSSAGEDAVRRALSDYRIDGAYCADRSNNDFEEKVRQVIRTTVKKVQDLNNMRGLIMAETSDIDNVMLEIIRTVLEKGAEDFKEGLSKFIFDNVGSKVKEKKDKFEKYNGNRIDKIIYDTLMFDSHQKVLALQYIIDTIDYKITIPYKRDVFLEKFNEIKNARNLLAHATEVIEDGKRILKSGSKELEFTDEFCVKMRVKIKEHGKHLNELLVFVSG